MICFCGEIPPYSAADRILRRRRAVHSPILFSTKKRKPERTSKSPAETRHLSGTKSGITGINWLMLRNMCGFANRRGLQNRVARNFVMILRKIADQRDGDEIQHDRVDNFVRAEFRLQNSRNRAPDAARRQSPSKYRAARAKSPASCIHDQLTSCAENIDDRSAEFDADPRRRKRGDIKLTFRADIQKTAAKRDRDRQTRKDQRRGDKTACSRCR